ncbi:MAG TPA: hypothetical protein VLL54_07435 [Pyrinomonadaceae bacterium]|nr:hypothetical protein [Pyrinomonadaceae bacterium]
MSKRISMFLVLSLGLIVSVVGFNISAQTLLSGDWTAKLDKEDNNINLNFTRRSTENSGKHQIGETFAFADLKGLTREQALKGGAVHFTLVREAGTIDCEGSFQNGSGAGSYRFTGSQAFLTAMKSRGFDFEKDTNKWHDSEDRLFTAAALNITTAQADDLLSAGFGKLDVDDLFKAAIFKVDSKFMREMKDTGFPNMGMEELVKARIFKIDANFVRQATQMGFAKESFEGLVKMQIFKVTPEFLSDLRNEGLTDLSVEEAVKLRIFKVDAEFIRKARAEGVPVDVESLVRRRLGFTRASQRAI